LVFITLLAVCNRRAVCASPLLASPRTRLRYLHTFLLISLLLLLPLGVTTYNLPYPLREAVRGTIA
jgi:hypothetical protein